MLIYNLLDRYPLMKYQSLGVHVLLHGLSEMNVAALKAIAWCGQISDFSLRISVVGIHISDRVETLRLDVPGLFTDRYDIRDYCVAFIIIFIILASRHSAASENVSPNCVYP